jgi:LysM repeat protein
MKRAALVLLAATVCRAALAQDDTQVYRVKQNDTLSLIAAEFYGDRTKAGFIMVENKMTQPRPLRPGERLRVPVSREVIASPGETFQSLAETYLGNPRRGSFLAELNKMPDEDRIPAGTPVVIPFTVTHTAQAVESLGSIAATYFNDRNQGEMLKRYNFLDKTTLEKGEAILVPSMNVQLQASKMPPLDAEAKERKAMRRDTIAKAAIAIPRAQQAWRIGEVRRIEPLLGDVDPEFLDTHEAVEVLLLRGFAHVAEGKTELAVDDFKNALLRKPTHVLRKFDCSPKILAVWAQAEGKVE